MSDSEYMCVREMGIENAKKRLNIERLSVREEATYIKERERKKHSNRSRIVNNRMLGRWKK